MAGMDHGPGDYAPLIFTGPAFSIRVSPFI